MLDILQRFIKTPLYHVLTAILFFASVVISYKINGINGIAEWGGSIAAAIGIFALVFKTQGYWVWSIINAGLWFYLFGFQYSAPILAGLQVGYVIFSLYGIYMWATVKFRIGYDHSVVKDNLGSIIATAIFIYTLYAYRNMPGYTGTGWWWVEVVAVGISIISNWMDAFKYKTNWVGWTLTNILFAPFFFYHLHLMGPFILTFLYQALCIVGFVRWYREEKRLAAEGKVKLVGGAQYA